MMHKDKGKGKQQTFINHDGKSQKCVRADSDNSDIVNIFPDFQTTDDETIDDTPETSPAPFPLPLNISIHDTHVSSQASSSLTIQKWPITNMRLSSKNKRS